MRDHFKTVQLKQTVLVKKNTGQKGVETGKGREKQFELVLKRGSLQGSRRASEDSTFTLGGRACPRCTGAGGEQGL